MNCQERSGFLFAHDCERMSSGACGHCGKSICLLHTRFGAAGVVCITCSMTGAGPEPDTTRQSGNDPFTYAGETNPSRVQWDDRDRAAFGASATVSTSDGDGDGIEDDAQAT